MADTVRPPGRVYGVDPVRVNPKEGNREHPPKRETRPAPQKKPAATEPPEEAHQLDVEV